MAFVSVTPDAVASATEHLETIGSTLSAANASAAPSTTGVAAMGADEVSAAITRMFVAHAEQFRSVNAAAANFHTQFVRTLSAGAAAYSTADVSNLVGLQPGASNGIINVSNNLLPIENAVNRVKRAFPGIVGRPRPTHEGLLATALQQLNREVDSLLTGLGLAGPVPTPPPVVPPPQTS